MPSDAKRLVENTFGRHSADELWTGNYEKVLPLSIQNFDIGAVLPAVFYMFRYGKRRGRGKFVETFAQSGSARGRSKVTIDDVAAKLAEGQGFAGFETPTGRAILGDLLLTFCLENKNRLPGRDQQVQKVAPTHFLASWVDLPKEVGHLRYIPEMLVALLSNQDGEEVKINSENDKAWFPVGCRFEDNELLRPFSHGIEFSRIKSDRKGDRFHEEDTVSIDELLMVRIAQGIGEAPAEQSGKNGSISNQRPIAGLAARNFSEDIRLFVRAYADVIPRQAFLELLESCIAVGLTTIFTSTVEILTSWTETGELPSACKQRPAAIFVDCSNGTSSELRAAAEQSMEDFTRRAERLPVILMVLRILDQLARRDPHIRKQNVLTSPDATEWINLLGQILFGTHPQASQFQRDVERQCGTLAETLAEEYPEEADYLRRDDIEPHPVWRLAEVLTRLMGHKNTLDNLEKFFGSASFLDRPNGLAASRRATRTVPGSVRRRSMVLRRLVFTDAVLDYLVHLHALDPGRRLRIRRIPLSEFLRRLEERYGFYVQKSPPGIAIPDERLRANRMVLERRLRDLGLFIGVNDAEGMKSLQPRFTAEEVEDVVE
jgi:hypothetical protein